MRNLINWKKTPISFVQNQNPFTSLHREIDKTISEFYSMFNDIEKLTINPSIDVVEDDNNFKIVAELPGIDENDINVSIRENTLIINAKKQISKKDENKNYLMREIGYGNYTRTIILPENIDTESSKASFKKGMLWIVFSKKKQSEQSREIKIEKA